MTGARPIRILVADDNANIRSALTALIDSEEGLELSAVAADASEAVELAAREQPDIALIDVRMPAGGGVAAVRGIATRSPRTRVILLSASGMIPDGLDREIAGCIAKGSPNDYLVDSLKRVAEGGLLSIEPR